LDEVEGQSKASQNAVNTSSSIAITLPGLDAEQSKQLLQFLANLQVNKQSPPQESCGPHGTSGSQNLSTTHIASIHLTSSQYVTSANTICCTCKLEGKICDRNESTQTQEGEIVDPILINVTF